METVEKIAIVGSGVVGLATGQALSTLGHQVTYVDVSPRRRSELDQMGIACSPNLQLGLQSTLIFVAVPTPSNGTNYDLTIFRSALESIGKQLAKSEGRHVIATRSTVPPMTAEQLVGPTLQTASGLQCDVGFDVASAPEFLRQATALDDALHPWMTVVGARNSEVRERLAKLFAPLGGEQRIFEDPTVTELIKIVHNCFNASKISFFNEIASIASALGIDADQVAGVVVRSAEAARNPQYGTRGGFAYGGACLPKDMDGLIGFAQELELEAPLLRAVRQVNDEMVKRQTN